MATNLPSLRDSKMTRGRWGKGERGQFTGDRFRCSVRGVRCEVAGDSSEEAERGRSEREQRRSRNAEGGVRFPISDFGEQCSKVLGTVETEVCDQ